MAKRVILLSGPVGAGKSTLARELAERNSAKIVKTRDLILQLLPATPQERHALQGAGERLDRRTKGKWVIDALRNLHPTWFTDAAPDLVIIDSVRIQSQIDHLRRGFGKRVVHIHITASQEELAKRYASREPLYKEAKSYRSVAQNPTESRVGALAKKADIVIDTDRNTERDVVTRALSRLGLLSSLSVPLVDVVIGAQYGSEGKGNICAYLAPEYDILIRVGSVNAGHQVYLEPIVPFHQIPSGALHNERAKLILGPGTQIGAGLKELREEIAICKISYDRLSIDPQAMIIEQEDANWEMEHLRSTIASTAKGVGKAASRRILRGKDVRLAKDIPELQPYIRPTVELLERAYARGERIMLEGTQGTLLSLFHGAYPFVTSRDTTAAGCMAEAGIAPRMVRRVVMVARSTPIRVQNPAGGSSGPMSQEISFDAISERSGIPAKQLRDAEMTTSTNRQRRVGEFDWSQLRRAALLSAPTDVALTFVDYLRPENRNARRFEQLHPSTINFVEEIERVCAAPVSLISTRFHWRNIIDRRRW